MALKAGFIGLPNVGKSSLFCAITKNKAQVGNYPFTTIKPNIATIEVPDQRLDKIAEIENSQKKIYSTLEILDIAGMIKGASKGLGKGSEFLQNVSEADLLVHVVRCFDDQDVLHVEGKVDPIRDVEIINFELRFADMIKLEKRILRLSKNPKKFDKQETQKSLEIYRKIFHFLEKKDSWKQTFSISEEEKKQIFWQDLYLFKPMIFVANVKEEQLLNLENEKHVNDLKMIAKNMDYPLVVVPVQLELDMTSSNFLLQDYKSYLETYNLKQTALESLIKIIFKNLGYCSFLTVGKKEARAWNFKKKQTAQECAALIHSDFFQKFVKVKVCKYENFVQNHGWKVSNEKGQVITGGKDYLLEDGDIVLFLNKN